LGTATIGSPSKLRLRASGSSLQVFVNDGAAAIAVTDAAFSTVARHGVGKGVSDITGSGLDNYTLDTLNAVPLAPLLVSPGPGVESNLLSGPTFTALFKDPGDNMQAFAFRRKIGAGAYEYWNAGTGNFQASEVWNAQSVVHDGTVAATFPQNMWAISTTYLWSMATRDTSLETGVYAADSTVISVLGGLYAPQIML
jgi:hypothetical protein